MPWPGIEKRCYEEDLCKVIPLQCHRLDGKKGSPGLACPVQLFESAPGFPGVDWVGLDAKFQRGLLGRT